MVRALLVAAVLLAGCGGGASDSDVAQPVKRHLRALAEGDFSGACRELTASAQGDVIGLVAQADGKRRSCSEAYRVLVMTGSLDFARAGVMDLSRARHFGESAANVEVLDASAAHARARLSGSSKEIDLSRGGGGWKISALDFTDLP
jgi:hypothetical protein